MKAAFFALIALPLLCLTAHAAGKKAPPPEPPPKQSLVTAVNSSTHEVTILYKKGDDQTNKKPTVYTIDDLTTITIDGTPGKFSGIRAGMVVDGTTERDAHTLDNITLEGSGAAPAAAAAPAKKK